MAAVGARRIFVGTSDRPVIEVLSFDAPPDIVPVDQPARPISRRQRRAALLAREAQEPLARTRDIIERIAPELPQPSTLPYFRGFVADVDGNLWVRTYEAFPGRDDLWVGYRPSGEQFARLMLPADLQVTGIGPTYVLGVQRDALGVEHVDLYALTRPLGAR